jgi:hypothetical protein
LGNEVWSIDFCKPRWNFGFSDLNPLLSASTPRNPRQRFRSLSRKHE